MSLPFFFTRPFFLLLWLPLAAAARLLLRSPAVRHRRAVILRLLAVALVVLALGGPELRRPEPSSARIYLADLSDSVTPAVRDAMVAWLRHELELVAGDERHLAAIVAFGSQAVVERPLLPANRMSWLGFQSRPDTGGTDLSSALALAAALVPEDRPARLVLISDGIETTGSALLTAAELKRRAIPVDVLPLPATMGEETGISALRIPSSARRGETLWATISVWHSGPPTRLPLRVELDGAEIFSRTLEVLPGQNSIRIPLTFAEPGLVSVRATIISAQDTLTENNRAETAVLVGDQPRVLIASATPSGGGAGDGGKTALARVLPARGISADFVSPLELPGQVSDYAPYAAVVLDNLPAYLLSNAQLEALQQFVTRLGGGLVVLGGPNSFGPGGYFGTPLEDVLPVYSETPERVYAPSLTLLLLLDQSGSMGAVVGEGATKSKLEIAQQAALGAIALLNPADLVGVLAFESTPAWVVPLQRAENQSLIARQISRLQSGGGTAIAPALEEAIRVMESVTSAVKHVILLTDGQAEGDVFTAQVNRLRQAGATLSTVAVGQDADRELLQKLAAAGAGRYYYAGDPNEVPRIFVAETATVTQELRVNREFTPREVRAAPFIRSLIPTGELPPLGGYTITTPKPDATVYYTVPPGGEPLLAEGRFGLGKSIVFTSGLAGSWGESWRRWPLLGEFLAQLILAALPASTGSGLNLRLNLEGDRAILTLEALNPDGTYRHFLTPTATLLAPDGRALQETLTETGPGLYQATFPASAPGRYLAHVTVGEERAVAVAVQPYSAEYRHTSPNLSLLFELTAITGGRLLTFSDSAWNVPDPGVTGSLLLYPVVLALAACLYLADLSVRYLTPAARARLLRLLASIATPAARAFARLLAGLAGLLPGRDSPTGRTQPGLGGLKPDEMASPYREQEEDPTATLLRQRLTELGRHPASRWRVTDLPPENWQDSSSPNREAPAAGGDGDRAARLYLARRRRRKQGF
ncbi:MAG: VWA domain-containing protein [Limnochordales bacterium]|nr:VWA domain-containing protein [Limnochordales bacterium]